MDEQASSGRRAMPVDTACGVGYKCISLVEIPR